MKNITTSESFKRSATRSVLSIALFLVVYLSLVAGAVGLTILCTMGGAYLIFNKPMVLTIILGAGIISMGVLILIFLVKFIFKQNKIDRSHLTEITEAEQPELFAMIREIVQEVKTDFPKKVYLSPEVNAAVFYDSSFWSMFLPVRKNLQIGLGLVSSVSVTELKAILAHEFGHFSQKSMKVGSYVYNVNRAIFNMLYDNQSFGSIANGWAQVHGIVYIFVMIAVKVVEGIQWILQKIYGVVNMSYMQLSREMEFHADEVAAHVAGAQPMITSLTRMDLADYSYNSVLNFYNDKVADCIVTDNIYAQHRFVMRLQAEESEIPVADGLPCVSLKDIKKYNKSKLVIKDQWASHPTTEERIAELKKHGLPTLSNDTRPATMLFKDTARVEELITQKLFASVTYAKPVTVKPVTEFTDEYVAEYRKNDFPRVFNSYYNTKNPLSIDVEAEVPNAAMKKDTSSEALFSSEWVDKVYSSIALESDLNTLKEITLRNSGIKTFDYDGVRYKTKSCHDLVMQVETELKNAKSEIEQHDKDIFAYFYNAAKEQGKEEELIARYKKLQAMDKEHQRLMVIQHRMVEVSSFVQQALPVEVIEEHIVYLGIAEKNFQAEIQKMLQSEDYLRTLKPDAVDNLKKYATRSWTYFTSPHYNEEALQVFFAALSNFTSALFQAYFNTKKDLLDMQANLHEINNVQHFSEA